MGGITLPNAAGARATRRNRTGDLLITNGPEDEATVIQGELSDRNNDDREES